MEQFIENTKILYVDDEVEILNAFTALMRKENIELFTLQNSQRITEVLNSNGPFSVVLSDQRMPEYDGVQVLEKVRQLFPETIRILITGYSDYKDTIRAINIGGITSYISKPWDDDEVKRQVHNWIAQYNLKQHNKYLLNLLDEENKKLNELLEGTIAQTVRILGDLAKHVSPVVAELSGKVKDIGTAFLDKIPDVSEQERWEILRAFDLFNLGIAILPPVIQASVAKEGLAILNSSSVSKNHHLLAAGLLKNIPRFENVARIIELHGKDYNGLGEPRDCLLKENEIPLGARLLHILVDLVKSSTGNSRGMDILRRMQSLPQKYDGGLLKQILGKNLDVKFISQEKLISLTELKAGMILVDDIKAVSGQLLLKANVSLTNTFINIILQWHSRDPIVEPVKVRYMT